ncbi:ABC transporter substrate-binding protein [Actinoallomurus spadix]|uniref:ABC transporter substrate-binding protein n=2 Tax=Actinoallomurus spadix TaxID=79912 RepID=A0ABN0WXX2_9ACTN
MAEPRVRLLRRLAAVLAGTALTTTALSGCSGGAPTAKGKRTIAIAHISRLSVIDDNVAAFKAELAQRGYVDGKNVKFVQQDANGQRSNISLLAHSMVGQRAALIYALGTDLNLAFAQLTKTPVIFGLTTDPVGAGLIPDLKHPGGTTTGTSDFIDPATYFDYLQLAVPGAKRVALMGNIGESNTATQIKAFAAEARKRSLDPVTAPVPTTNDIVPAIRSLKGRADVILIGADSTLSSADAVVIKTATDAGIPVVFNGSAEAGKGALIGLGPDYAKLGKVAGDLAADVLEGKKPGDIPVALPSALNLVKATVNRKVAASFGLKVSDELAAKATAVGD